MTVRTRRGSRRAPLPPGTTGRRWRRAGVSLGALALTAWAGVDLSGSGTDPDGPSPLPSAGGSDRIDLTLPAEESTPRAIPPTPRGPTSRPPKGARGLEAQRVRIPDAGSGTFRVVEAKSPTPPDPRSSPLTYTVEVERELPLPPRETARTIDDILADSRSWGTIENRPLRRVSGDGDARILLSSPATTDKLCAPLETRGKVSCRNGDLVVLNARRWAHATDSYRDDVRSYRIYLVNHEVGHLLGRGHEECPGQGLPAPVMQQQTYGLDGCRRNVWPSDG